MYRVSIVSDVEGFKKRLMFSEKGADTISYGVGFAYGVKLNWVRHFHTGTYCGVYNSQNIYWIWR